MKGRQFLLRVLPHLNTLVKNGVVSAAALRELTNRYVGLSELNADIVLMDLLEFDVPEGKEEVFSVVCRMIAEEKGGSDNV